MNTSVIRKESLSILFLFLFLFNNVILAQSQNSKTIHTNGSIVNNKAPISGERVSVSGNRLYTPDGDELLLAGAVFTAHWSIPSTQPEGNRHNREAMFQNMDQSGANFVVITVNPELWSNTLFDNEKYKSNIDTFIQWAVKHNLFFQLRIQCVGNERSFSGPGSNYKITLPQYSDYKERAIQMLVEIAQLYKSNPNFVGLSLLNEPYSGKDYSNWDSVISYYYEAIDSIRAADPDCIIWVMEPYQWGSSLSHWVDQGFLQRDNVVYEYHIYYHHWTDRGWGEYYAEGDFTQGYAEFLNWHNDNVLVAKNLGYPVFAGEFGIYGTDGDYPTDGRTPDPYYREAHEAQMKIMNDYGIHYTQWVMYGLSSSNWGMASYDGYTLSERGSIWADNLPTNLKKP